MNPVLEVTTIVAAAALPAAAPATVRAIGRRIDRRLDELTRRRHAEVDADRSRDAQNRRC